METLEGERTGSAGDATVAMKVEECLEGCLEGGWMEIRHNPDPAPLLSVPSGP